ncbi:hypothetical protein EDC04DRAFT_2603917 [Pisolithus marmoratus]|nr:hypothetical protein EDC04DRAFT_2603917 [Pisolithus marmoratus]
MTMPGLGFTGDKNQCLWFPSEGDDPVDSYRWLDRYNQLHYEAESICNYAQGMHVAIPELPEAIKVSMAATDLAIVKPQSLHLLRIFMVPPGAWFPSNMEGYGNRLKQAWRQTERVAAGSGKGKQKMTQDNDNDDGQGDGDDGGDQALEPLEGPCEECSREGRGASCEGEPQQACLGEGRLKALAPSPTIPSPEIPVTTQSWLFLRSMTPSSVQYPNHALTPANFSPLAGVDELQELFEGGFSVTVTGLLQDDKMLVVHEEMPVMKEESPIKTIPQETLEAAAVSPSPPHNPSSSPARMMLWLHALDKHIKWLEEIVEMNKAKVAEMHEDLVRFTMWVSRFRSAVLEQQCQLREIQELQEELLI